MTQQKVISLFQQAVDDLDNQAMGDAMIHLKELARQANRADLSDELSQRQISYALMLKYLSKGVQDPARGSIMNNIRENLYLLADRLLIELLSADSKEVFYVRNRELSSQSLSTLFDTYRSSVKNMRQQRENDIESKLQQVEIQETQIFNKIWSSFPLTAEDAEKIRQHIIDSEMPEHCRCLMVTALFVGLMKFYDENKLKLLLESYWEVDDPQIQLRSLICAVLTIVAHQKRILLSNNLASRIEILLEQPHVTQDLWDIQMQLARTRNTENVTKQIKEDLIGNLMKLRSGLMDKLQSSDVATMDPLNEIEGNPEWQQWLEESGIGQRIEAFNQMQQEGNDVFIATFSHLKSFPFFQTMSNWFLPFHKQHSLLLHLSTIADTIVDAPYLCNSDKYSFCLSLNALPEAQRNIMSAQLAEQNTALNMALNENVNSQHNRRTGIINAFVQDLYRFFKLFSRRHEFIRVLDKKDIDLTNLAILGNSVSDKHIILLLGEFYLKNRFYKDAIKCYSKLEAGHQIDSDIIYQKIGFAYQRIGNYTEALKYYQRFDLLHEDNVWNLRHMASCLRELGDIDKSMDYYRKAEKLAPDNINLALNIGHFLLEQSRYQEALQQYYKVDLMGDSNHHRAWRPIAWCSFLLKNYDRANDYYEKIIAHDTPKAQDLLNWGHVKLCQKNIQDAINTYRQAWTKLNKDSTQFRKMFKADSPELLSQGVSATDLILIPDAVCNAQSLIS